MRGTILIFLVLLVVELTGSGTARAAASSNLVLTPKGKAIIEAEIRKHLPNPASAVFSDWLVHPKTDSDPKTKVGSGMVKVASQKKPALPWMFDLRTDGTLTLVTWPSWPPANPSQGEQRYKTQLADSVGFIGKDAQYESFLTIVKSGNYKKIKDAIEKDRNIVNAVDDHHNNALHIAAQNNLGPEIVKLLLKAGSAAKTDLNATNGNSEFPIDIYNKNKGNKKSIEVLKREEEKDKYMDTEDQEDNP